MNCTQRAKELQRVKEQETLAVMFSEQVKLITDPVNLKAVMHQVQPATYPKQDN